ncbi:hypothetical protein QJS10_CPA16g00036 [Acorus calamus]|uniref:RPA-interacting protein n=1 Tax=Acorus calamus TaxID=4465 RepID=A0AAV9CX78_ACOCL|nr:hypothetical protein QJS10_CPA16g00036 [Acorus calamus]
MSMEAEEAAAHIEGWPRPRRPSLRTTHIPDWKEKLRKNCLKRVQENRMGLLWKIRSPLEANQNIKIAESTCRDIVSDELEKIKRSSPQDGRDITKLDESDILWEYDDPQSDLQSTVSEREGLLIEMERLLYEDLREELLRRELEVFEEEDNYLTRAVFDHMQLNDDQGARNARIWCPICKQGELLESNRLIFCTCCELWLDVQSDQVNLDYMRDRLGEVHMEHLDRGCKATPKFCMETTFGLSALYIKCQACNTFEIVL